MASSNPLSSPDPKSEINRDQAPQNQVEGENSLLHTLRTHKREVVDCLIASRAAYQPDLEGVADILERKYDSVDTSKYELLFHQQQPKQSFFSGLEQPPQVFVIVRSSNGYVIVAFRGTFTLADAIADGQMSTVRIPFAAGRAHGGIVDRVMHLPMDLFMNLPRKGEKIIFTGHSLGAGVASLTSLRVLENLEETTLGKAPITRQQVLCITFGTAPFANEELASYINSKYRDRFYHLISKHDLIPRAHNMFPKIFFPLAQKFVGRVRGRWEVKFASALVEQATGMAFEKAIVKLEDKMQELSPATAFFSFMRDCMIDNQDALFYGLSGYVVLFDPDATDCASAIKVGCMENIGEGFNMENKSLMEIFFEHGLANYYDCLLHGLGANSDPHKNAATHLIRSVSDVTQGLTLKQILADPATAFGLQFYRLLLKLAGNEFQ